MEGLQHASFARLRLFPLMTHFAENGRQVFASNNLLNQKTSDYSTDTDSVGLEKSQNEPAGHS